MTTNKNKSPSLSAMKELYAKSAGQCNICQKKLCLKQNNGEIAHIVAKSSKGTRGNIVDKNFDRNHVSNLILLCSEHHKMIDNDEDAWPREKLLKIKEIHERNIELATTPTKNNEDLYFLNELFTYIPIIKLNSLTQYLPIRINLTDLTSFEYFDMLKKQHPDFTIFNDCQLSKKWYDFYNNWITLYNIITEDQYSRNPSYKMEEYSQELILNKDKFYNEKNGRKIRDKLENNIDKLANKFIKNNTDLIQYIKINFPGIKW